MKGHAERSEAPVKDKVMLSGKVLRGKVLSGKVLSGKVMLNGKGLSGKGHAERQGHAERSEASMHSAGIIDNSLIMTILPLSPLFARSG